MFSNNIYLNDLKNQSSRIDFDKLDNKSVLITGACGLICSYAVDLLLYANMYLNKKIKVYVLSRNENNILDRFSYYKGDMLIPVVQDVCKKINIKKIDYIIHGASNASPKAFINDPVGTMNANYLGSLNVLELAKKWNSNVIYISSSDIYGNVDVDHPLSENEYGVINILEERASYASSKRASETLCFSYSKQYNTNVKIVRPAHIYGPTYTKGDSRAVSDFIRNVIEGNDIIMKSNGESVRSYCYVGDTVVGIFKVMLDGLSGEAYNISNENNIISIKELANIIAKANNKKVIIDLPKDEISKKIDKNVKMIKLSSDKLRKLGWDCLVNIEEGINISVNSLKK